eukprot:4227458-Karenia_brevis.AAC.1
MSREQLLKALEVSGEVIAIGFEMQVVGKRFEYTGIGYFQFRHPSSLHKAWDYEHCKSAWGVDPEEVGVSKGKKSFILEEQTRDR